MGRALPAYVAESGAWYQLVTYLLHDHSLTSVPRLRGSRGPSASDPTAQGPWHALARNCYKL